MFDVIVASAVRLRGARMGAVFRFDCELIHLVAHHNYSPELLGVLHRTHPRPPQSDQASGRAILTRTTVQVEDTLSDPNYLHEMAQAGNWRSILAVPMLREGLPIGAIVIARNKPGSFAFGYGPSAHGNYWRKSGNTCRKTDARAFTDRRAERFSRHGYRTTSHYGQAERLLD